MKTTLILAILLCIIAHTAHSEPPQNSVETDIAVIKTEIKNLKESMNTGFANVQQNFANVQQNFANVQQNFANVQQNFDRQNNIIIACIGVPMVILTISAPIWGMLAHKRNKKEDTLQNQIETLMQEIETLKQQRIVS